MDIQLDLFLDHHTNVVFYPAFQEYFCQFRPPILAIWGKYDPFFIPAEAEAYCKDNPAATVRLRATSHFAPEIHVGKNAAAIRELLDVGRR